MSKKKLRGRICVDQDKNDNWCTTIKGSNGNVLSYHSGLNEMESVEANIKAINHVTSSEGHSLWINGVKQKEGIK